MNKKIFGVAVLASVVISAAAWNFNQGKNEMKLNDIALANVEALAQSEGGGSCKWRTGHSSLTGWIAICDSYGVGYNCRCGEVKYY